jgi:hypothetical protein
MDGGDHHADHSGGPGAKDHGLPVRIELRDIQMAVGID